MSRLETGSGKNPIDMQPSFSINWGIVSDDNALSGWRIYALWPAPVNDDTCFAEAGYRDFQSDDEHYSESYWDVQAERLHQRLIEAFSHFGQPGLLSTPLCSKKTLFKFWQKEGPLTLNQQLCWPMYEDSVPHAALYFGDVAELLTGNGHVLYWIRLSSDCPVSFESVLLKISSDWPSTRVQLDWKKLGFDRMNEVAKWGKAQLGRQG